MKELNMYEGAWLGNDKWNAIMYLKVQTLGSKKNYLRVVQSIKTKSDGDEIKKSKELSISGLENLVELRFLLHSAQGSHVNSFSTSVWTISN